MMRLLDLQLSWHWVCVCLY